VHWELATALALIEAGAEVLVLRHPESLARLHRQLDCCFVGTAPGGDPCR
jgi:CO dehydrogenase/acetyl-CoA synthase delta subunit